jgi:hypothetical protein
MLRSSAQVLGLRGSHRVVEAPGLLRSVVVEPLLVVGLDVFPCGARGVDDSSHLGNSVKLIHVAPALESMRTSNLLTKQPLEGINMHMVASRLLYLSISTPPANAPGGFDTCMCMCACMENLNLRDTF